MEISAIIPVYNTPEKFLIECLDSVVNQTFSDWECILVDDGSTNSAPQICDEYAKKDSRFVVIHKIKNEGQFLGRKTALDHAKGKFIASLDSDDICFPEYLEKLHRKIIETNSDFCVCRIKTENFQSNMIDYVWSEDLGKNIDTMYFSGGQLNGTLWGKLIKKEIFDSVEFPNIPLVAGEDIVILIQAYCKVHKFCYVNDVLYFHRTASGSVSRELNNLGRKFMGVFWQIKTLRKYANIKNKSYYLWRKQAKEYYLRSNNTVKNELEREYDLPFKKPGLAYQFFAFHFSIPAADLVRKLRCRAKLRTRLKHLLFPNRQKRTKTTER